MLSKTECSYTTSGTPSIIGVTSFTYGNGRSDVLKKITLPNGQTFTPTHDIVGNPSSVMIENGNTMAAMWSYGRRLTMVVAGPDMFTYDYNADGIRTTKTVNGVKHTYALSGTTILNEEWTENGVQHLMMYVYDANGSPVGMVYRNSTMAANATEEYLFVKNIQGDILYVYGSTGNKLVSYVYDAWGNIISTTYSNGGGTSAARFNPFTYRGYYRDSETGMYYLNSRYYNPKMGRFINTDEQLSGDGFNGYNLFVYCGNNPVMNIDLNGDAWLPFQALLYWGEVHFAVQAHIIANNEGWKKEVGVAGGRRIDLVDNEGGIYEVKPVTYFAGYRLLGAVAQLDGYLTAESDKYHIGTQKVSGQFVIRDKISVSYFSVGQGIILYSFKVLKNWRDGKWDKGKSFDPSGVHHISAFVPQKNQETAQGVFAAAALGMMMFALGGRISSNLKHCFI